MKGVNFFKILLLTLCLTLLTVFTASCVDFSALGFGKTVNVTFETESGVVLETKTVEKGSKLVAPSVPKKAGYEVVGWMILGTEWNFNTMTANEDVVLVAKWQHADHLFDHECDQDCNMSDCDYRREILHVYDNGCDPDCNACGYERDPHTWDGVCDGVCNKCGGTRDVPAHTYDNGCDTDCNECGEVRVTEHVYASDCDASCNECGDIRVPEHYWTDEHDDECNGCGHNRS